MALDDSGVKSTPAAVGADTGEATSVDSAAGSDRIGLTETEPDDGSVADAGVASGPAEVTADTGIAKVSGATNFSARADTATSSGSAIADNPLGTTGRIKAAAELAGEADSVSFTGIAEAECTGLSESRAGTAGSAATGKAEVTASAEATAMAPNPAGVTCLTNAADIGNGEEPGSDSGGINAVP